MSTYRSIDFRYAPPISWTSICRPDDPYKTLVREDGALMYDFFANTFESWFFQRVFEFSIQAAPAQPRIHQRTESARIPVVVTTIEYPRAVLELRAFGHLRDNQRTDVVLWRITANADVDEFLTGIHIDAYEMNRRFVGRSEAPARTIFAVNPALLPPPDRWAAATRQMKEDETQQGLGDVAFISSPQLLKKSHSTGFRPASGLASEPVLLHAGESIEGAFIFPLNHTDVAELDYEWALNALEHERNYWNSLSLSPLRLEVPDTAVMEMLEACSRNILQAREIENGLPVFKVGPTVYRNLFVVDGHFMLEAAQYLGYDNEARAAIGTLLQRVRANGAITVMEFHTKETGISLATLVRQAELHGDDDMLRNLWQTIRNGVGYIESLRAEAKQLPTDDPCHNLLPRAFGDGGVGGERGEYTTTFWILFGLKSVADAAERLGYEEDARRFRADFDELLTDFRAHAAKYMRVLPDGSPYLPMCFPGSGDHHWIPSYQGDVPRWHRLNPASATWAMCHALWPGEVFSADDPLVSALNHLHDMVDDEEGIPADTGWLPYKAVWGYHASFAAHVWLYSGRPDKAIDYLYALANHASPTRVWREEQSLKSTGNGQLFGDMPHNWASVEFIRLVRNLLVFERGDTLELLPGLPREWIKPGASLIVERTPTRFGAVSLKLTSSDGVNVSLRIQLDAGWKRKPNLCLLHIRGASEAIANGDRIEVHDVGKLHVPVSENILIDFQLSG